MNIFIVVCIGQWLCYMVSCKYIVHSLSVKLAERWRFYLEWMATHSLQITDPDEEDPRVVSVPVVQHSSSRTRLDSVVPASSKLFPSNQHHATITLHFKTISHNYSNSPFQGNYLYWWYSGVDYSLDLETSPSPVADDAAQADFVNPLTANITFLFLLRLS